MSNADLNILLTGATGFIGSALVAKLCTYPNVKLTVAVREESNFPEGVKQERIASLESETNWEKIVSGMKIVVHCAGLAHVKTGAEYQEYLSINAKATNNIACAAKREGVEHFIFLSTIKVHGERSLGKEKIDEDSPYNPQDFYSESKVIAERDLIALAKDGEFEYTIIRPPMVYGPASKGNFQLLEQMIRWNLPLPIGLIESKRSFVSVKNLVHFICLCIDNPKSKNEVFVISDGSDLSTLELSCLLRQSMKSWSVFLPVPVFLLKTFLAAIGKGKLASKFTDSCQLKIDKSANLLGWRAPQTPKEAIDEITNFC